MGRSDLPKPTKRLSFGTWHENSGDMANALWGDATVTELTGGPFTRQGVARRLGEEIAHLKEHGIQYWPLFSEGWWRVYRVLWISAKGDEREDT